MKDLDNIVNNYLNNQLLNLSNLDTKLETKMIDRLFAKKFRKYSIAPQVKIDVETKLNNIILSLPDWERIPNPVKFEGYGSQRGFRKCTTTMPLQKKECSIDFVEIDDSQMSDLPFA